MIDAHSLSWTGARLRSRLHGYRGFLTFALTVDFLIGVIALLFPRTLSDLLYQPDPFPLAWPRAWGALLIGASVLCLAGLSKPAFYRWPNWAGIALRLLLAIVFLLQGPGFYLLGVWEAVSGVVLLILYPRFLMAELGTRP